MGRTLVKGSSKRRSLDCNARRTLRCEQLEYRLNMSGLYYPGDVAIVEYSTSSNTGSLSNTGSSNGATSAVAQEATRAATAINQFAFDLYEHFQEEEGNLVLSPTSIATALAMTYAGARGETASQMADVLHLGEDAGIHDSFRALLQSLQGDNRPFDLSVANALWPQVGFPFKQDFLQLLETKYGGNAQALDFEADPLGATETINQWVEENTQDKIKDLLSELEPSTRMVLTNAVYFNAQWATEFDPNRTRDSRFYPQPDESIDVPMMYVNSDFRYTTDSGTQILEMPYEGGDLSMVFLLPPRLSEGVTTDKLQRANDWLNSRGEKREVYAYIPRFKATVSSSLSPVLAGMGMPDAFDRNRADLTGMADGIAGNLFVQQVEHKAFIDVNEQGTEAAAATSVGIGITCFAAGTPVMTAEGSKPVEEIKVGDYVFSRDEHNLEGPVELRRVEKTYQGRAETMLVRVGEQEIRTTSEHPFFVRGRGWTPAAELQSGDLVFRREPGWIEIEEVVPTGQEEAVYNFHVADYCTYFVGTDDWGFGVWVHNFYGQSPPTFRADRPFHYFIRDNTSGAILFMGRVTNPLTEENVLAPSAEPPAVAHAVDDEFVVRSVQPAPLDVLANDFTEPRSETMKILSVEQPAEGGEVILDAGGELWFQPAEDYFGPVSFAYTMGDAGSDDSAAVSLHVKPAWHNAVDPYDVNRDGHRSPIDALGVINAINLIGSGKLEKLEAKIDAMTDGSVVFQLGKSFPDTNADGHVGPIDALHVINYLEGSSLETAHGESPVALEIEASAVESPSAIFVLADAPASNIGLAPRASSSQEDRRAYKVESDSGSTSAGDSRNTPEHARPTTAVAAIAARQRSRDVDAALLEGDWLKDDWLRDDWLARWWSESMIAQQGWPTATWDVSL